MNAARIIFIILAVSFFLNGCATSVHFKMGECSTKMTGLFLAHGLAPANVADCKPETY